MSKLFGTGTETNPGFGYKRIILIDPSDHLGHVYAVIKVREKYRLPINEDKLVAAFVRAHTVYQAGTHVQYTPIRVGPARRDGRPSFAPKKENRHPKFTLSSLPDHDILDECVERMERWSAWKGVGVFESVAPKICCKHTGLLYASRHKS
jgi:hypothetical protein